MMKNTSRPYKPSGHKSDEILIDLERGDIWYKAGERLTGAELRILSLLHRREGRR